MARMPIRRCWSTRSATAPTKQPQYTSTGALRRTGTEAVALTFDDGPTPAYTPQVLGLLARHRAHDGCARCEGGAVVDVGTVRGPANQPVPTKAAPDEKNVEHAVGHGQDDRWDAGRVRHPGLIRRMRRQGGHSR